MRILQAHAPDECWRAHRRAATILRHQVRTSPSPRKQGRIISSKVLFDAGIAHATGTNLRREPTDLTRARHERDGAMIAFLALVPIRRGAFTALALGKSLVADGNRISVVLEPEMTKTGAVGESALPESIATPLRQYLRTTRLWLMSRGGTHHAVVWVDDRGRPYHPIHLGGRITRLTQKLTGAPVSPHLFRDCAATTLAYDSPDAARLTRAILGHVDFRTATRHYNQARSIESGHDYAALIEGLRRDSK